MIKVGAAAVVNGGANKVLETPMLGYVKQQKQHEHMAGKVTGGH
jgi:hypothetical protein